MVIHNHAVQKATVRCYTISMEKYNQFNTLMDYLMKVTHHIQQSEQDYINWEETLMIVDKIQTDFKPMDELQKFLDIQAIVKRASKE